MALKLDADYLEEIGKLLESGKMEEIFHDSSESKKYEILDFLEQLMNVADKADEVATRLIFKDSYLEVIAGVKTQK